MTHHTQYKKRTPHSYNSDMTTATRSAQQTLRRNVLRFPLFCQLRQQSQSSAFHRSGLAPVKANLFYVFSTVLLASSVLPGSFRITRSFLPLTAQAFSEKAEFPAADPPQSESCRCPSVPEERDSPAEISRTDHHIETADSP